MTPVDAVLFDFGMVLSGPTNPVAWARMRSLTGLDEEPLHREYWGHRHPYDRGDLTSHTYWHLIGANNGLELTPAQVAALIEADVDLWADLNPPMVEWAQQLQRAGVRTGILSNMPDAMAEGLVARFDWIENFHHCTWSHSLNLAKPEGAIYRHAAEGLATDPAKILFIDDRAENIAAARDFGMQAIQYTNHQQFLEEMRQRGFSYLLNPQIQVAETSPK